MFSNYGFNKSCERRKQEYINQSERMEKEYNRLLKKYQDEPDTLIKDYDTVIINSIIAIISNFNETDVLRDDIIANIDCLIRIREFIIDKYSNNSSNND